MICLHPAAGGFLKFRRREQPAVAVENLDGIHARLDLHLQIGGDGGGEFFGQRIVSFRLLAKQVQGAGVFLGAAAFHHERGQRPRRTGETDERGAVAKFLPQNPQRLVHVAQLFATCGTESFSMSPAAHRKIHFDAAAVAEFIALPHPSGITRMSLNKIAASNQTGAPVAA
jgi:hypothetical protein